MAIFTFEILQRDSKKQAPVFNGDRKIVNIEEYRGTVLLPAGRIPRPAFQMSQWSPDPLNAA
jgi:hypothetical protein